MVRVLFLLEIIATTKYLIKIHLLTNKKYKNETTNFNYSTNFLHL